jgi:methyltransferase (TIGR00027 family)|tara:strand:- start:12158 stop:13132 length:975 start_codon:yes stop_codon:yes gene_type:complete
MAARATRARPGRAVERARRDDARKGWRGRGRARGATRTKTTTTTTTTETSEEEEATWTRAKIAVRRRIEGAEEDVYANALASEEATTRDDDETRATTSTSSATHAMDVLAFRRLSAMMNTFEKNVETHGIARQVVVITAGADTRAFRLPFPSGTAIFECADGTVHTKAAAVMKKVGAKPSKGCSHRRVPVDATATDAAYGDLEERLERAGYRPDVRSLWLVQDVHAWDHSRLSNFITESADLMTTGSELIIDASALTSTDDIIRREFASNGVMPEVVRIPADEGREPIRLVLGCAQRVSLKESEYYREQLRAAEDEADEDGFED